MELERFNSALSDTQVRVTDSGGTSVPIGTVMTRESFAELVLQTTNPPLCTRPRPALGKVLPTGISALAKHLNPSALSSLNFGVRPKLYDAPRRRNHDAERRATKFANPRF